MKKTLFIVLTLLTSLTHADRVTFVYDFAHPKLTRIVGYYDYAPVGQPNSAVEDTVCGVVYPDHHMTNIRLTLYMADGTQEVVETGANIFRGSSAFINEFTGSTKTEYFSLLSTNTADGTFLALGTYIDRMAGIHCAPLSENDELFSVRASLTLLGSMGAGTYNALTPIAVVTN